MLPPLLLRPALLKNDFHPRGDLFDPERLRLGKSITVWYLAGKLEGPPPTSMYSWSVFPAADRRARVRASSRDSSLVGVEIANDFGRQRFGVAAQN